MRRFIARRGRISAMYSDNGTNFTGLNNALRQLDWTTIESEFRVHEIRWKFNPPSSPFIKREDKINEGDIVLIGTDDKKRLHWLLGRVLELFPGKDGIIRLVKLRTGRGDMLRPIQRLYPLEVTSNHCQVIYSQFGLAIHQNDHQTRRRFVEWAQNDIAVVPDFHKRILLSDEAHFWLNGYVNKQNCRIWSEANPQVYVETPLHPEKLTVWCALWAGGILLQKR
ncbi:bel12-ag transposon polyprotein [Trichonephila clavipes]|nr:bel12-ag transposon polyprotein [Trichonephila clavipes]